MKFNSTKYRIAAWLLFLSLACAFVVTSPKNPPQFFAAAIRQQEHEKQHLLSAFERIDPVRSNDAAKLLQLNTLADAMRGMELDLDCKLNRPNVDANRDRVLLGLYRSTPDSTATLTRSSEQYRVLQEKFNQLRDEIHADQKYGVAFRDLQTQCNSQYSKRQNLIRFACQLQRIFWHRFQAMIFWPKTNAEKKS